MIARTKTVESEGIPATPIIEAEKIPTTPITGDGSGGGGTLPPNLVEGSTIVDGEIQADGTIGGQTTAVERATENYIELEGGYDYLIIAECDNDSVSPLTIRVGQYSQPNLGGTFIRKNYTVNNYYFAGIFTASTSAPYVRISVSTYGGATLSVTKVDKTTITNYINMNE